jgi:hypothetical protein
MHRFLQQGLKRAPDGLHPMHIEWHCTPVTEETQPLHQLLLGELRQVQNLIARIQAYARIPHAHGEQLAGVRKRLVHQ